MLAGVSRLQARQRGSSMRQWNSADASGCPACHAGAGCSSALPQRRLGNPCRPSPCPPRRNQLKLQGNALTGSLPPELSKLSLLEWLRVFGEGWAAACMAAAQGLRMLAPVQCWALQAASVKPYGTAARGWPAPALLAATAGALPRAADNRLTGTIPEEYSALSPTLTQASLSQRASTPSSSAG